MEVPQRSNRGVIHGSPAPRSRWVEDEAVMAVGSHPPTEAGATINHHHSSTTAHANNNNNTGSNNGNNGATTHVRNGGSTQPQTNFGGRRPDHAGKYGKGAVNGAQHRSKSSALHPCLRVYGLCNFDDDCTFANYPYEACLNHIKGKCRFGSTCKELHVDPRDPLYQNARSFANNPHHPNANHNGQTPCNGDATTAEAAEVAEDIDKTEQPADAADAKKEAAELQKSAASNSNKVSTAVMREKAEGSALQSPPASVAEAASIAVNE